MPNWKVQGRKGPHASSQQRAPASQPRSAPPPQRAAQPSQRPGTERGRGAGGCASGGASEDKMESQQSSVRDMIQKLDKQKGSLGASPSKKRRVSRNLSPLSASSSVSAEATLSTLPVTEAALKATMMKMVNIIKHDMTAEFEALREDFGKLHNRIKDLEDHIASRDLQLDELERCLCDRDARIMDLQSEVDQLHSDARRKDLILSGPAVPLPPSEPWTEDVVETTVNMLQNRLPGVRVSSADLDDAFRIGKGKNIVVKFRSGAKNSLRNKVYESRFQMQAPSSGANDTTGPRKLFVRENLSPYRQKIFSALLTEKLANRLYTVFTKNGEVYCKMTQYGRKIKIESLSRLETLLKE